MLLLTAGRVEWREKVFDNLGLLQDRMKGASVARAVHHHTTLAMNTWQAFLQEARL